MNPVRCPKCGKINDGSTYFCIYCGTIFDEYTPEENSIPPIFLSVEKSKNSKQDSNQKLNLNNTPKRSKHTIAILIGYFFAIMGSIIGLIIAIYLITRDDPNAKKHAKIQIGILVFELIIMFLMIWTGAIDYHALITPFNMTTMQNMNTTVNMSKTNALTNMSFL